VRITVNRLILYPLLFFVGWLPDSISLVIILATGRESTLNRMISNAFAASVGWAMAVSYFYYQRLISKNSENRGPTDHSAMQRAQHHIESTAIGSSYIETQRSTAAHFLEPELDLDTEATLNSSAPGSEVSASGRHQESLRSSSGVFHDGDSRSTGSIASSIDPSAAAAVVIVHADAVAVSVHEVQAHGTRAL
jgi:hypothetical protein